MEMGDLAGWAILAGVAMYFLGRAFWQAMEIVFYVVTGLPLVALTLALPLLLVFGGLKGARAAYGWALGLRSGAASPARGPGSE